MNEFNTSSGAKVVIGVAPYEDVMELKSCIFDELRQTPLGFDLEGLEKLKDKDTSEIDLDKFFKAALALAGSRSIRKALMTCLIKSTYNGQKITPATFEDEKAREDYYEICFYCLKVNLSPFFKGLVSKLSAVRHLLKSGHQKSS